VHLGTGDKPSLVPPYFQRFMHAAEQVSFHHKESGKVKCKDSGGPGILPLLLPSIALGDLTKRHLLS